MSALISLRLPEEIILQLEAVANITDRSKSYLIKKAIEHYLEEYADYQIALDRLHDKDDKIVNSKDMRKLLDGKNCIKNRCFATSKTSRSRKLNEF